MKAASVQRPLAAMISLALLAPLPTMAGNAPECTDDDAHACTESGTSRVWLWGGLAALGLGAAAAGGGGGGGGGASAPGAGAGGGGGTGGPAPGTEGGSYGRGGVLLGAGVQASWSQPLTTRITGDTRNDGQLQIGNGTLHITDDGELRNNGTLQIQQPATLRLEGDADLDNHGTLRVAGTLSLDREASLENHRTAEFDGAQVTLSHEAELDNHSRMTLNGGQWSLAGDADFDNNRGAVLDVTGTVLQLRGRAEFENGGTIQARGTSAGSALIDAVTSQYGNDRDAITVLDNRGSITHQGQGGVLRLVADSFASQAINRSGGHIQGSAARSSLLTAEGTHATLLNQGTLTVTGDGTVAMDGRRGATLLNDGVINLGTATESAGRGLIAMKSDGSATLNNRRTGVINIHSADSFAFQMGAGGGRLINNGVVNIYGAGSAMHADAPTQAAADAGRGAPDIGWQAQRSISGYTIGTNANGSAGQLALHDGGTLQDVDVDTGFTRGTDASNVTLKDVVTGAEGGAENVRSATVTWSARAHQNAEGGIDVVMQRRDYRELASADQAGLASALEAGYRNDALFHGLEVADQREFQRALHQLSGADVASRSLGMTGNADALWSQLAALPADRPGVLSFGGGARNDFGVRGDGSAAHVALGLGNGRTLQIMTAALKGELGGAQQRGHSRFAGVGMAQQWGTLQLRHQFGYERHGLEGQRSLAFGQVREVARSQRQMHRSMLATTLSHQLKRGNLHWQPRLKGMAFQLDESAFSEASAGSFGLQVAPGRTRGLRMELGSQWAYSMGPNLRVYADVSVAKAMAVHSDARHAQLLGAAGQSFVLPGLRAQGLDHQLALGLDYRRNQLSLGAQLVGQRVWGQDDSRAELQLGYRFR